MSPIRLLVTDRGTPRKLIALLGMVLLAVMSVVTYLIWSGYQAAILNAETKTRDYAAILEARLEASLRRADADLWELAKTIPVAAMNPQAVPRYARELYVDLELHLYKFKEIGDFLIADRHGDLLYSAANPSTPRVNVSDREYFRQLRDNPQAGPVFSEVIAGRITKRPVIVMARALTDGRGGFLGIILAPLDLEHFQTLFQSLALGPQSLISFRRSDDQRLVLRWPPHRASDVNQPLNPQNSIAKRMAAGDKVATVHLTAQIDGVARIFSYQALEHYPFYINVGVSRDHILAEWRARSLMIGAMTLLLMGLLAWLLIRLWRTLEREKQAEEALRRRDMELIEAQQLAHLGSWFWNLQTDAVSGSAELARIYGIDPEKQRMPTFKEQKGRFYAPENWERMSAASRKTIKTGVSFEMDVEALRADGAKIWVTARGAAVRDAEGRIIGMRGTVQDITERKHAEEALRLLKEKLDATLQAIPDLLFELDENGCYHEVWAHDETLLVAQRERLLGHTVGEMLPPDAAETVLDALRETAEAGVSRGQQIRLPVPDGEFWFELSTACKGRKPGEPLRFIMLSRDITPRKQAEDALRLLNQGLEIIVAARTAALERANAALAIKEEETRSVVHYMVDCVITIDEKGIIHSANPVVERIFGYTLAEVLGQNVAMLMPEPHRGAHDGYLEHYRRTGQAHIIGIGRQVEGLHKNGERIALDLAISEYFAHGQRFFTGILRDIRDQVRIMKELEQARLDAEQATQAKSAFLAAMSHEIRTPMNGVIGMVDVLHQTSLRGDQAEIVDTIRDSAYSLLGIIEDILDFSKIEAGKLEIERASTPVATVMAQVCKMLDHLAAKKGVELTLFSDPAIPAEVLGDALRLRQVLVNLASNAIKFSSGGQRPGKVSLRARLAGRDSARVTVEFQVADNGIGMDEQTQARLFTSFSQADVSTTRRFGGTGLGLAISSQLVKLMGGEIAVHSVPDQSSRFTVRLPFVPLPAKFAAGEVAAELAGLSCLVVGSAEGLADDLAVYLRHAGAAIERAPDLAIARQRASAQGRSSAASLSVWVIDAGDELLSADELHFAAAGRPDLDVRFVLIGRGQRREPRAAAADLVEVDGNALGRHNFLRAVAIAAGRAQPAAETPSSETPLAVNPPSHQQARHQGRLILVAEDNATNQQVILRQLALFGLAADIVDNGGEALECWRSGDYALLLTDLHMPQMDGYALAAAIRAEEKGFRRTPIVALTANALAGEAERCREAGMDDYLSKPAPLEKLKAMLDKWLPIAAESMPGLTAPPPPLAPQGAAALAVDVNVLKALVGGDAAVVREFLLDFHSSSARIAAELRAACLRGQTSAASAAAHKLKSAARTVGALALGEQCAEMEQAGKAGDSETLAGLLPRFEQELVAVEACLDSLLLEHYETARR